MKASIDYRGKSFTIDLHTPIDLSIAISDKGPRAWYVGEARFSPVINQHFTGSVRLGGSVNFRDVFFNPHGHGTHTESLGHISREVVSVNKVLKNYFFLAEIITAQPERPVEENEWMKKDDWIISKAELERKKKHTDCDALIVRTLPNDLSKKTRNYSDTNFCYIESEGLAWIAEQGIDHLLVDLPSVDRESDGGLLKAHHAFWKDGAEERTHCTITEFVFVPDHVEDGLYLLNLQVAPFENDAAPSRVVVFRPI